MAERCLAGTWAFMLYAFEDGDEGDTSSARSAALGRETLCYAFKRNKFNSFRSSATAASAWNDRRNI